MRLLLISLILGSAVTLAALSGCAAPVPRVVTITRAEPVPYPARPAFAELQNGDVACMSHAARLRLGQRHTEVVWYVRELEGALRAYDAQTVPASQSRPQTPEARRD